MIDTSSQEIGHRQEAMQVMKCLLLLVILPAFCSVVNGNGSGVDCNVDLCISNVEAILAHDPFDCLEDPKLVVEALAPCQKNCGQEAESRLEPYVQSIQDHYVSSGCHRSVPSRFTVSTCTFTEQFRCITGTFSLVNIVPQLQIEDMAKLCSDIQIVLTTLHRCERCIETLVPGFETWSAEAQKITNITITMLNGGCNCSRQIMELMDKMDTSTECETATFYTNIVRVIANECTLKLINYPLQVPWLDQVEDYINFFLPFIVPFICGNSLTASGSSYLLFSIHLLTISLIFLLLLRKAHQ